MRRLTLMLALIFGATPALAHKPSDAFITVDIEGTTVSGQLDFALKDLELALGLDRDGDGKVTWGELKAKDAALRAYAAERLAIATDRGPCTLVPLDLAVTNYADGAYATLLFNTSCMAEAVSLLNVRYDGLFDVDAQHRGLFRMSYRDEQEAYAFTDGERTFTFDPNAGGWTRQMRRFVGEGMRHIFRGYDHMLFLVALLLPAVFWQVGRRLVPKARLSAVLIETAKVVTAFTAAHTLSLCLTTFGVIRPPPTRLVETLVALTILLTALNNLFPTVKTHRWIVGFVFGLVHGIGYASALSDLGLEGWHLASPLVGFNVGVEIAQLVVLAVFLPLAFLLRRTRFYKRTFLYAGSALTCGLAAIWIYEQVARVSVLPF